MLFTASLTGCSGLVQSSIVRTTIVNLKGKWLIFFDVVLDTCNCITTKDQVPDFIFIIYYKSLMLSNPYEVRNELCILTRKCSFGVHFVKEKFTSNRLNIIIIIINYFCIKNI